MKSPGKKLKMTLLLMTGAVLFVSFASFAYLLVAYSRGGDANNEDVIRKQAEKAFQDGDFPTTVNLYRRLIALNPFEKRYQSAYLHALVGVRDFETLAAATNNLSEAFALTAREEAIEAALTRGSALARAGSNELAVVTFASVTNLNYVAATPFLIQAQAQCGRPDLALTIAQPYIQKFPLPPLVQQAAEWSALAHRQDLLDECRQRALAYPGRPGIVLAHYCDALTAWLADDAARLVESIAVLKGEVDSPLAHFLALEAASAGDDAAAVERAFDKTTEGMASGAPLVIQARAVVKRFLAEHFPQRITLEHIQRLTNAIYDPQRPDVDILRLSILAKASRGVLLESELNEALRLFPNDRGLQIIRRQQQKN